MARNPELVVASILQTGFATVADDPSLTVSELFEDFTEEEQAEAKQWFETHSVAVYINWPREPQSLPYVAIVNGGGEEDVSKDAMGDFLEMEDGDEGDIAAKEWYGFAKNLKLNLIISSQDPRLSIFIAHVLQAVLLLNRNALESAGYRNAIFGESDLRGVDESLFPSMQNGRVVTISGYAIFSVAVQQTLLRKFSVAMTPTVQGNVTE